MGFLVAVDMDDRHDLCAVTNDNFDRVPGADEDVSRFEVSVEAAFTVHVYKGPRDLKQDLQGVFSSQAFRMVVNHGLKAPSSTELKDKNIGGRAPKFFKVINVLDNVGLGEKNGQSQRSSTE